MYYYTLLVGEKSLQLCNVVILQKEAFTIQEIKNVSMSSSNEQFHSPFLNMLETERQIYEKVCSY